MRMLMFRIGNCLAVFLILALLAAGIAEAQQNSQAVLGPRAQAALSVIRGNLKVPGLQQPVTVLRDRWGVAHIYARNQHDLFFAQGFVAAQDRLFQMELWKRSGQGRLAEVLGPSALFRDVYARRLQYRGDLNAEYNSYGPETRQILEAFTSGINAYIARRTQPGGPGLPLEFKMAGFAPEPWTPQDCLNRMAAFSMTGNAFSELAHAQAVAAVGAEEASRLFDFDPPVKLTPAPGVNFAGLSPGLLHDLVGSDTRIEVPAYYIEGSNNWTISGALTATGKPLLANDPHRVLALPSLRYMVHLVAPGWDVIGAGEPGLPGVAVGHNQHIAWGFTIFGEDQQDLYLEQLNPKNPDEYRAEHGWERMQVKREVFHVRGQPDVIIDLKFTRHGPVLWQDGTRALALRWVGAEPGTAGYLSSLSTDQAQNWQQFVASMRRWKVPSENIVYADTEGNVGEYSVGLAPLRKNWTGLLPVPGTGAYEWAGFIPFEQLPHSFNPAAGFVASANHKMIPDKYPYNIGYQWASPYRFQRIRQVLEEARGSGHKLTIADMEALQNDVTSLPGQQFTALLRQAVGGQPTAAEQLLLAWDGKVSESSGAAALFELALQDLRKQAVQRALPQPAWALANWGTAQVLGYLSGEVRPAQANQLIREVVRSAAERLAKLEGPDPARWSWGGLHHAEFRHPLDGAPGAAAFLDLGPVSRPGDNNTVDAAYYGDNSFEQLAGASYREIFDLQNWDESVAVNTPGQSGQPGSPHYSDLLPLWERGQYFPLAYSRQEVEKQAADRLVLEP